MKNKICFSITLTCFLFTNLFSQEKISAEKLQEDFAILKKAVYTIHPGLYKYHDEAYVANNFNLLEHKCQEDLTLNEAFIAFSKCVANIKCGHTLVNPFNQNDIIKNGIIDKADKLPFTLEIFNDRIFIVKNLSQESAIKKGSEIIAINGFTAASIIDSLLTIVSADGSNHANRINILQLTGQGYFETFDSYFAVFFPAQEESYTVSVRAPNEEKINNFKIKTISRGERFARMEKKYGPIPNSYDDLWEFKVLDKSVGYLKLGTFVTYKMKLNWKKFIDDAFQEIKEKEIEQLIIDIRGNGGGMSDVSLYLGRYLVEKPIEIIGMKTKIKYETIPDELRKYMSTWDDSFYNHKGKVVADGEGYFVNKNEKTDNVKIKPDKNNFKGKKWLLVDAANSSATFTMAKAFKENKIATLVGTPTGGNKKGINGGGMFFLTLPNSNIEVDIPIYGYYPLEAQPDEGVTPNVIIPRTPENIWMGTDPVLDYVMKETN
ncbi:MAG: S41 family peptidase [Bacteroidota bacterium]